MKKHLALFLAFSLFGTGCSETEKKPEPAVKYKQVGTLLKIQPLPTSFNERMKSQVVTTKGFWVVVGLPGGMKGENVVLGSDGYIYFSSTGDEYLTY